MPNPEDKTSWRNPATLIAIGGLLVSLLANWTQHESVKQKDREIQLKEQELLSLREKMKFEIEKERKKIEEEQARKQGCKTELDYLASQLAVYESRDVKRQAELQLEELSLRQAIAANRRASADAARRNIKTIQDTIEWSANEQKKLLDARKEAEARCR